MPQESILITFDIPQRSRDIHLSAREISLDGCQRAEDLSRGSFHFCQLLLTNFRCQLHADQDSLRYIPVSQVRMHSFVGQLLLKARLGTYASVVRAVADNSSASFAENEECDTRRPRLAASINEANKN